MGAEKTRRLNKVRDAEYVFLHVGKTGGTSVAGVLDVLSERYPEIAMRKLGHRFTMRDIVSELPDAKLSVAIRDPRARFVSAFNSRLRSGRPDHESVWTTEEAVTFLRYPTANDLAEALFGGSEMDYSASRFAVKALNHLKRGYKHHFHSVEMLKKNRHRFYCVVDTDEFGDRAHEIFAPFPVEPAEIYDLLEHRHAAPKNGKGPGLSAKAEENLRRFWPNEFAIYDYCRTALMQG